MYPKVTKSQGEDLSCHFPQIPTISAFISIGLESTVLPQETRMTAIPTVSYP
jgi:hypothetical protein